MSFLDLSGNLANDLLGGFSVGEIVLVKNLGGLDPIVDFSLTKLIFAFFAQIGNFCLLRVANIAEVVEKDSDAKVLRKDTALVLADVFRGKLQLRCCQVTVIRFDEGGIEHNAEERGVRQTAVLEDDLDVTMQGAPHPLSLSKHKGSSAFLSQVLSHRFISEQQLHLKPMDMVYFKERINAVA